MRKLITEYLLEHTQHSERHLASLGDATLLQLYNETRDVVEDLLTL